MESIKGRIFTADGTIIYGEIVVEGDRIAAVNKLEDKFSANALHVPLFIPGLVDIHTHGCMGHDTCDASLEGELEIAKYQREHGITSFCPTTMTLSTDRLSEIVSIVAKAARLDNTIKGIYLEGPFISKDKKGAQNEKYICPPDIELLDTLNMLSDGLIKIVAIAPEIKGAIDMIRDYGDKYTFSLAHTNADTKTAKAAILAGAKQVTHLYNAMRYSHREPGVVGAVFEDNETSAELICDGIHVHPLVIKQTFKQIGDDRIILISDSMEATGMPEGKYELGGQEVFLKGKQATLLDGTIAGSASNLFDCLKYVLDNGVDIKSAIFSATRNPAKRIGIYDEVGSLEVGKKADILIVDDEFELIKVIRNEEDLVTGRTV